MCRTQVPGASGQGSATDPRCRKEPNPDCPQCGGTGKIKGMSDQVWGGDPACAHQWGEPIRSAGSRSNDNSPGNIQSDGSRNRDQMVRSNFCTRCIAWRGQLGLEPSPDLFVEHLVMIFREARRVLRRDGTLWCNIGDSYAGSWGEHKAHHERHAATLEAAERGREVHDEGWCATANPKTFGCKPKDLIGVPWMLAFALRSDGWYLRRDIIWAKKNCMPESVEDRPTTAHEYIFMLAKSRKYFYDAEAIREQGTMNPVDWNPDGTQKRTSHVRGEFGGKNTEPGKEPFRAIMATRNKRSVWTVATEPYVEAHFATMPTELVKPCILAGTSARGCCAATLKRLKLRTDITDEQASRVRQWLQKKGLSRSS